jgi:hypothetical protein
MTWLVIRTKTEGDNFNAVRSRILTWNNDVAIPYYQQKLRGVASRGAKLIRQIIIDSTTPTGEQRKEAGGNGPGRINSKDMYNAVGWKVSAKQARKNYSLRVGWVDGRPGYAIFQEHGTRNGVAAMNAIQQAQEQMLTEIRAMSNGKIVSHDIEVLETT